jgi:fructose-1,6-bisphosphatase/inositol monophosphatase family enzyme
VAGRGHLTDQTPNKGSDHGRIANILTIMPTSSDNLMEKVGELLREISAEAIEPRFESLRKGDVRFKSPGEVVTVADEEAERLLKVRLGDLIPDAMVIGEEEFSGSTGLADALNRDRIWLVDPLDGTANFVAGSPQWASMVALVEGNMTTAAWIWQPTVAAMYQAEVGAGTERNGVPIIRQPAPSVTADFRGAVLTKFLDTTITARVDANRHHFGSVGPGTTSAGVDYPLLVEGEQEFVMFWRTLPWDHVPGALMVTESGGCVRRLNGDRYSSRTMGEGLLAVSTHDAWQTVRDTLLGDLVVDSGRHG